MSDTAPRTNHWLWAGPLTAAFGLLSYFLIFAKWPMTRDVAWVNLPLVWGGAAMTLWGAWLAWKRGGWRIAAGGLGAMFALACATLLTLYCFVLSYDLPAVTDQSAPGVSLPALTLPAHDGTTVNLAKAARGKLVVAFYRGAW